MDRIQINGIWYVPENSQDVVVIEPDREECYTIENSDFYFKAIRLFDQEETFFDDIDIHFIDKRPNKPKDQETWDNNDSYKIGSFEGYNQCLEDLSKELEG
jgi:hypothetical protein